MKLFTYVTYKKLYEVDVKQDIVLRAKNTNIIDLYCLDENDVVVDITGAIVFLTIKDKPSDDDDHAILKKTLTTFTDPTNGNTEIEITPTDCSSLLGNFLYDIKIKMSDGKIYMLSEGNVCFRKELTERIS